jgi:hypothetical protein
MKKIFKIAFITGSVFVVVALAGAAYSVYQLPSILSIVARATSLPAKTIEAFKKVEKIESDSTSKTEEKSIVRQIAAVNEIDRAEQKRIEKIKLTEVLVDDLISSEKPISDFCTSLAKANDKVFNNKKEFRQAFKQSINEDQRDPRIQALKPVARFVLRLPHVAEMTRVAQSAVEQNDKSFLKKTEFYGYALVAFVELKQHTKEIEDMMDRSYLLYGLNKLVAKNPDVLKDPRLHQYCDKVETAFNQSRPIDFESERKEFLNFLEEVNATPNEINFNPSYKSELKFQMTRKKIQFEGGWVNDLILADGKNF